MVLPLLLLGGGTVAGAYFWGKRKGEISTYKEVINNEPAASKLIKSLNSLALTIGIIAAVIFIGKKFGK